MTNANVLIEALLSRSQQRKSFDAMAAWFDSFNQQTRLFESSIDRAILGGRLSLNVGFAFTSGYQSAIESLFEGGKLEGGKLQGDKFHGESVQSDGLMLSSLCVTEVKGNHPRAIETRLYREGGRYFVDGNKQFVSGACDSQMIYVACRDETVGNGFDDEGKPKLKVVAIPTQSQGVAIQTMPVLGFIPEVSHGKVKLERVEIVDSQVLEGDGYLTYVKAFRTFEDLHVLAAIVGYRLGEAIDSQWDTVSIEAHISLILALRAINFMPLAEPVAHISLAACRRQLITLIEATNTQFESHNPLAFENWQRDQVLLKVASKAHQIRTAKAWAHFS